MSETYAYLRVSTREQNEDRQLAAIECYSIPDDHVFLDKESGKNFDRPNYIRMKDILKKGDLLYIKSIDRLGRNYNEILEEWRILTKLKEADIVVIDMPLLDTRIGRDLTGTLISDLVLQILSYVAENEYRNIKQRQREGIIAAKLNGVKFGRPRIEVTDDFYTAVYRWKSGELPITEAAREAGLSSSTFYRRVKDAKTSTLRNGIFQQGI
ncbi:MAG: recombinase family protein [Bullifex sp.]